MGREFIGFAILVFVCATAAAQAPSEENLVFEVASIKAHDQNAPNSTGRTGLQEDTGQVRIENLSLRTLIAISYGLKAREQLVGPAWLDNVIFDIVAKPPVGYKREQIPSLLRNLLTDRFSLSVHHETRPMSAFALVVANGGPKLHESLGPKTFMTGRPGLIEGKQRSMADLVGTLGNLLRLTVVNETGLNGLYDLKLEWTQDATPQPPTAVETGAAAAPGVSLFTALQEQLGLRLQARKLPSDVVVIDHVDRVPTAN